MNVDHNLLIGVFSFAGGPGSRYILLIAPPTFHCVVIVRQEDLTRKSMEKVTDNAWFQVSFYTISKPGPQQVLEYVVS